MQWVRVVRMLSCRGLPALLGLLCLSAGLAAERESGWADQAAIERVRTSLAAFPRGSRQPGAEANLAFEELVAERFAASGFEHGEMRFAAPHFLPGRTVVTAAGQEFVVHPLHPSLFRPGNFATASFATELVDGGRGDTEAIKALRGQPLRDRVMLLDFNSGRNWERFLRFGVKGFIFIEPEDYALSEAYDKVHTSETTVPRFFIDREGGLALRERIAGSGSLPVDIDATPSRWENSRLRNLWVLIPGADDTLQNQTALMVAPLDANCVVPGLAEGAQAAANVHLLLDLLEEFRLRPPARSVLLAAVNARTQNYLGDRVLSWYLLQGQDAIEGVRNQLSADLRYQELIVSYLERLEFRPESLREDEDFLIDLRTLVDGSTGRLITIKDPIVAISKRDVNEIKGRQLLLFNELREQRLRAERLADDDARAQAEVERRMQEIERERERLDDRYQKYVNVLTLFNRVGIQTTLGDLDDEEQAILRNYVDTLLEQNRRAVELNRRDLNASIANAAIREAMGARSVRFVVSLELVWNRPEIGFSSLLALGRQPWANRWGRNTVRLAEEMAATDSLGRPNLLADTLTHLGGHPELHYIPNRSQAAWVYQSTGRRPAFSLNTIFSTFHRAFTPSDTFARLELENVAETGAFLHAYLPQMLAEASLTLPSELSLPPMPEGRRQLWTCLVKAFKFDEFAAGVMPEIPVPGSVVSLASPDQQTNTNRHGFSGGGVVDRYWALTDSRATALIYGIGELQVASAIFRYDDDFRTADHVADAGETHAKINSNLSVSASRIISVIPCDEEITVLTRHDPSRVASSAIAVDSYFPLSAGRNSEPRKYGVTGAESSFSSKMTPAHEWGPTSFFLQTGERLKLLTEQKRLALNVDEHFPDGRGFRTNGELDMDFYRQAVRDMLLLNRRRYGEFRGVNDSLVENFIERGAQAKKQIAQRAAENDHLGYLQSLYEGLGALTKGYTQIAGNTNDMLKAVVFFMALLLPFCLFVQRLLFKTVRIEMQMLWFSLLFVSCYLLFRFIHPAFRIAQAPEAMFIAFVMGGLGLFVIHILHSRFEGEMKFLFSSLSGYDESQIGYSMVGQQAMMIGIGNMKRRRVRTMLTTATIILVTFTMLAFTSVSRQMSPTIIRTAEVAPYTGLMYHWPGGRRMDEGSWRVFDELFVDHAKATRRWLLPPSSQDQTAAFTIETTHGRQAVIEGILGLGANENGFLAPMPMVAGRFFQKDDAEEVVLSANLAEFLELGAENVGQTRLRFLGRWLTLVGIVDDERFRLTEDLNGLSILPIKQLLTGAGAGDASPEGDDGMDESGVFYVNPSHLLALPVDTARKLGAEVYSISVKLPDGDGDGVWPSIEKLLIATGARFYVGSHQAFTIGEDAERQNQPGVYFIGSGFRTSIGGLAMLVIPLLIASTIILNTMLGSVFERKNEIAVFNAIGLNPTHIGTFFLAESFVYGIVGSVGGYLIGQVLSMALNHLGWVGDVNLNFSSLSVAYVIIFTISVVLLSTLYPAIVATKAAVPSGKRKWDMPENDGNSMDVAFPFIYQADLVLGVMHYLAEYLGQFTETSTGDLIVTAKGCDAREGDGRTVYTLDYDVALAPFDLGVTETASFKAAFNREVDAYRVVMTIVRQSGQDSNWVTTNKPFLERLRKFLLHWRNLKPAEHDLHVRRGKELFGEGQNG